MLPSLNDAVPVADGVTVSVNVTLCPVVAGFSDDAIATIAKFAQMVNEQTENIGARRLHTILEKVLEEISFEAPEMKKKTLKVDSAYVQKQLANIVKDQDLSRYIL